MLPSERIELAISRFVESAGKGQWRSTLIGSLGTAVGNHNLAELVDALLRLQANGHIRIRKWVETRFLEYPHPSVDESRFFYQNDFQIKLTAKGRPYFELLASTESLKRQVTSNVASAQTTEISEGTDEVPSVFISYSWETEDHKDWVLRLAERLRSQGVTVILDHWHLKIGSDRTHFMESSISICQFVAVICTPTYAQKANKRHGGVGYEAMIITSQLAKDILQDRFIPVLRSGKFDDSAVPKWLQSKIGVDLRGDPYDEQQYELLLRALHKAQPVAPPVGPKPKFSTAAFPKGNLSPNPVSPRFEGEAAKSIVLPNQQVTRKRRHPIKRPLHAVPVSARIGTRNQNAKHGRSTIPDNFLLGSRNAWAALLEESWPEIGWPLLCGRDSRNITIDDIYRIFGPVKEKPHNSGLAAPFYRSSSDIANPAEVLKDRVRLGELDSDINRVQAELDESQRLCQEAGAALKMANAANMERIEQEAARRQQRLTDVQQNLQQLKSERDSLDSRVRDREAYVYRFQLRDFLMSGQLEVNPRNLANALAGLPTMPWRQSTGRCSDMAFDPPRLEYGVWELISEVWRRRPAEFEVAPVDFFKDEVLKLDSKWGYNRQLLWDNWRDLRNAIQECWKSPSPRPAGSIPFALTSIFMHHSGQQKDAVERILAVQEKLVPLEARTAAVRQ
jgi:TIR domain